jgi:hypothetical protein
LRRLRGSLVEVEYTYSYNLVFIEFIMDSDRTYRELHGAGGLVQAVFPRAVLSGLDGIGFSRNDLASMVSSVVGISNTTAYQYLSSLIGGNGSDKFPSPHDIGESANKKLYRLSVVLDSLRMPEASEVIVEMRKFYGVIFKYPPIDSSDGPSDPLGDLVKLFPQLEGRDALWILRAAQGRVNGYEKD